jgi:hypothetical protein
MQRIVALGIVVIIGMLSSPARAVDVCTYRVTYAAGVFCPLHIGSQVCISQATAIGACDKQINCFGGPGFFCNARLEPLRGPERQCPYGSIRPRGLKCYQPNVPGPVNTPTDTPLPDDTPTETPTATGIPTGTATATETPPATDTPSPTEPTATATDTATATETATAVSTATETPPATETATELPTGTPTGTTAAFIRLRQFSR